MVLSRTSFNMPDKNLSRNTLDSCNSNFCFFLHKYWKFLSTHMRMLVVSLSMSWVLSPIASAFSESSPSSELKRNPDCSVDQPTTKRVCANGASSHQLHEREIIAQQNLNNSAQNVTDLNICGSCYFKHDFQNDTQNRIFSIHKFSLFQLLDHPSNGVELNDYRRCSRHVCCELFKFSFFGKFYANLIKDDLASSNSRLLENNFKDEIKWLAFIIKQSSIPPSELDESNGPVMKIDGQPQYSRTEFGADELVSIINLSLPEYIKLHIRKYYHTPENEDANKDWSGESLISFANQLGTEFNPKMCEEMLKSPFKFYMHVEESMAKIQEFCKSNMRSNDNLNNIPEILSVIVTELKNIYNDENEDNFENNPLKVALIIYTLQILTEGIARKIKFYNEEKFNILILNFKLSPDYFQRLIYNLGVKQELWRSGQSPRSILLRKKSVQQFIDFIESYKSGKWNSVELSLEKVKMIKKIICFWIAKVVLCQNVPFVPTLCYILHKTNLMPEFSFYIIFQYSFIIKRLLFRTSTNFMYAWFEINDIGDSIELRNIIKPIRLVDYETFCNLWEEQQKNNILPIIKELNFSGQTNIGTEEEILKKVYDQLEMIYNYMNNEIVNARSTIQHEQSRMERVLIN